MARINIESNGTNEKMFQRLQFIQEELEVDRVTAIKIAVDVMAESLDTSAKMPEELKAFFQPSPVPVGRGKIR